MYREEEARPDTRGGNVWGRRTCFDQVLTKLCPSCLMSLKLGVLS